MDETTLNSTAGVEIVSYLPNLRVIRFVSPTIGDWDFEVRKFIYSVVFYLTVEGICLSLISPSFHLVKSNLHPPYGSVRLFYPPKTMYC